MRTLLLANQAHMGDIYLLLNYLRRACAVNPDVEFHLYVNSGYIPEFSQYTHSRIKLMDIMAKPNELFAFNVWVGYQDQFWAHPLSREYQKYYHCWWAQLSLRLNIVNPISTVWDTLNNDPRIFDRDIEGKYDLKMTTLLINCQPLSGQIEWDEAELLNLANKLESRGHLVQPIWPLPGWTHNKSTWEMGLNLYDLAKLALKASAVVGILTGPYHAALSVWSIDSVKKWGFIDGLTRYTYKDNHMWARNWDEVRQMAETF